MRMIRTIALGWAIATLTPLASAAQDRPPVPADLTDEDKLYGLSLLWREAAYNFAFFDQVPDLDWDATYRAFVPQVLASRSTVAYYEVLERFVALLKDGHTRVWLPDPDRRYESYPWVLTRNVESQVVVDNVGRGLADALPVGSVIATINDRPAAGYALDTWLPTTFASTDHDRRDRAIARALHGPPAEAVTIAYRTPGGDERTLTLARDRATRDDAWLLPTGSDRPVLEFRWLDTGIAYVALNTFNDPAVVAEFQAVLPELYRARALVIDVRRNGGGNSGHGYAIAAYLTDDTLQTSHWRTREHVAAYKAWGARSERYADFHAMRAWRDGGSHGAVPPAEGRRLIVPTAVLQEHGTFSAAEDFLVAIDAIPHVTTVGRPSGGSTGQPLFLSLPGGGSANICTKRDTFPDGRDFVGVGVPPDVMVETTVADVQAGRDPVLERAVALMRNALAGGGSR